ncbi:hypothetical protein CWE13_11035 [Aliidiomarina shirensis]|uniref:Uncharacterized protein n=1 Tax=Aliidiomarina shirensis TaxID=1048642 RepID=A0A432WNZ5_9GAMM|nr:hypothetical protein [Aliidiomarina shirensis]RUO35458.1 hypothetical protein CWE13_11035 [Aliidiomarina shirensis]
MNKTLIHIIFIPIIASLLFAWSYFSKVSESSGALSNTFESSALAAESAQRNSTQQNNASVDNINTATFNGAEAAYAHDDNQQQIAELNANIARVKSEINELNENNENNLSHEEMRRNEAIQAFAESIRIINHTDITEFETSDDRPEMVQALSDFIVESEHARGLGIQVEACTRFGCQLSIDKETQPIAELMRLNRVMMEQGKNRFGASSLHLVGSGQEQRVILVWHE